jgi:hypothetical protein
MTWQPIETAPDSGPVLLYFGALKFRTGDGETAPPMGDPRDYIDRVVAGYCEDGDIFEANTGHSLFEEWRGTDLQPTHWMPLPPPPGADT